MKEFENTKIIGIDHGYGNMKTAGCCFPTGLVAYESNPPFDGDILVWGDRHYLIGAGHKPFSAEKMLDEDYYVLTLAAIGRELNRAKITDADVFLAAGLPLTWVGKQKEEFKKYLLRNSDLRFTFNHKEYHVRIVGADLYPQGFAAIINNMADFSGANMLCDIGNGTMNVMYVTNHKPDPTRCFTEKFGTHQCMLLVRENLLKEHGVEPPEEVITYVLCSGKSNMDPAYFKTISDTVREYVAGIFRRLQEHGYDQRLMKLYVVGGGGKLIKHFWEYDPDRVTINEDICATAKGYERMAEMRLLRGDKL